MLYMAITYGLLYFVKITRVRIVKHIKLKFLNKINNVYIV